MSNSKQELPGYAKLDLARRMDVVAACVWGLESVIDPYLEVQRQYVKLKILYGEKAQVVFVVILVALLAGGYFLNSGLSTLAIVWAIFIGSTFLYTFLRQDFFHKERENLALHLDQLKILWATGGHSFVGFENFHRLIREDAVATGGHRRGLDEDNDYSKAYYKLWREVEQDAESAVRVHLDFDKE